MMPLVAGIGRDPARASPRRPRSEFVAALSPAVTEQHGGSVDPDAIDVQQFRAAAWTSGSSCSSISGELGVESVDATPQDRRRGLGSLPGEHSLAGAWRSLAASLTSSAASTRPNRARSSIGRGEHQMAKLNDRAIHVERAERFAADDACDASAWSVTETRSTLARPNRRAPRAASTASSWSHFPRSNTLAIRRSTSITTSTPTAKWRATPAPYAAALDPDLFDRADPPSTTTDTDAVEDQSGTTPHRRSSRSCRPPPRRSRSRCRVHPSDRTRAESTIGAATPCLVEAGTRVP